MKFIYAPAGRAGEYSPLAVNLFSGCAHGCRYCYCPGILRQSPESFHGNVSIRADILSGIEKDLKHLTKKQSGGGLFGGIESASAMPEPEKDIVMLCFSTDPYQGGREFSELTGKALSLFRRYDHPFQVLTKGGLKAVEDFDLYREKDRYAVTLTFDNAEDSLKWEPNAAIPADRIESLRIAKEKGLHTWVSLEPVLNAEQALHLIRMTHEFADEYKVGRCSGNFSSVKDWREFAIEVNALLSDLGKRFYLKNDLRACLPN